MANQGTPPEKEESIITTQCRNFKNYLRKRFFIKNYGNFIAASTFKLEDFDNGLKEAREINQDIKFFRLYYGCDKGGKNHTLYMAFLDANGNVIETKSLREAPVQQYSKCPPGDPCKNDPHLKEEQTF